MQGTFNTSDFDEEEEEEKDEEEEEDGFGEDTGDGFGDDVFMEMIQILQQMKRQLNLNKSLEILKKSNGKN